MNEIRDLLIGIDFGEKKSQICYYDRKENEAESIPIKVGTTQYEAPSCLCCHTHKKGWSFGLEAEYFAREHGGILFDDMYRISGEEKALAADGEEKKPHELTALFLRELLKLLGVAEPAAYTKCLVVTTPKLTRVRVDNLQKACEQLGFRKGQYLLMDYSESFYYYAYSQRQDLRNRNIAWYRFLGNKVSFRKLAADTSVKPALVRLEDPYQTALSEKPEVRDIDFCQFVQHTMGTELYSSALLTGEGFDPHWAKKSIAVLCRQQRKVMFGNNLFAKGACLGAKEKTEDSRLDGFLYAGDTLVKTNVGIEVLVRGSVVYHSLLEAGKNWYEASAECDILLDETEELVFVLTSIDGKETSRFAMELSGLPKRPKKASRISVHLTYRSEKDCEITVKDLGFGEFFQSSRKVWKETVHW